MEESGKSTYRRSEQAKGQDPAEMLGWGYSRVTLLFGRRRPVELEPDGRVPVLIHPPAIRKPLEKEETPPGVVVRPDRLEIGIKTGAGVDDRDPDRGFHYRHANVDRG